MSPEIKATHIQTELKVFSVSLMGLREYRDIAIAAVIKALNAAGYLSIHEDSLPVKLTTSLDVFISIPEAAKLSDSDSPRVTITTGTCPGVYGQSQPENNKVLFIDFQYNKAFATLPVKPQKNDWYSNAIAQAVSKFVKSVNVPEPTK